MITAASIPNLLQQKDSGSLCQVLSHCALGLLVYFTGIHVGKWYIWFFSLHTYWRQLFQNQLISEQTMTKSSLLPSHNILMVISSIARKCTVFQCVCAVPAHTQTPWDEETRKSLHSSAFQDIDRFLCMWYSLGTPSTARLIIRLQHIQCSKGFRSASPSHGLLRRLWASCPSKLWTSFVKTQIMSQWCYRGVWATKLHLAHLSSTSLLIFLDKWEASGDRTAEMAEPRATTFHRGSSGYWGWCHEYYISMFYTV